MPHIKVRLRNDLPRRGGGDSIWQPRMNIYHDGKEYIAQIVDRMGDTVSNFSLADGELEVTGDLDNYKAGSIVDIKLLRGERAIKEKR